MRKSRRVYGWAVVRSCALVLGLLIPCKDVSANSIVFSVEEGVVPGATELQGLEIGETDRISGFYLGDLTFTGGQFSGALILEFLTYDLNGTEILTDQLGFDNEATEPNKYRLYAVLNLSGTFTTALDQSGDSRSFELTSDAGTIGFFVDPDQDPSTTNHSLMSAYLIDSAGPWLQVTTDADTGQILAAIPNKLQFGNPTLTGFGASYWPTFADPTLGAYAVVFGGDVDLDRGAFTLDGARFSGESSAAFVSSVPEPGTLLLFGVALAGFGLARRRGEEQVFRVFPFLRSHGEHHTRQAKTIQ